MTITVYTKPRCVQCDATMRALDKQGFTYSTVDLTEDPKALATVLDMGFQQAPVVVAGDNAWAGFRPDKIKALATQDAAELKAI
ncbi:MAG: glutaredoxin-like protein NrdH [Actinomycetaceae bacterium]|nr:glutaredoxin-like protein NrdH [Actinomycetaceae bacterium]